LWPCPLLLWGPIRPRPKPLFKRRKLWPKPLSLKPWLQRLVISAGRIKYIRGS